MFAFMICALFVFIMWLLCFFVSLCVVIVCCLLFLLVFHVFISCVLFDKQSQGTMNWLGSGLVGWFLELHELSPRALRAKSKSFTSKVREPWTGGGLVWWVGF